MAFTLSMPPANGSIPDYSGLVTAIKQMSPQTATLSSALTTDTITAAQLIGGTLNRSGATGAVAATTDTAANIILALGSNYFIGMSFVFYYTNANTSAGAVTVTAGVGVTMTGTVVVPIGTTEMFIGTVTSATTVTINGQAVFTSAFTVTSPTEVNTAISTAGAGTLTAAGIAGGLITRTGPTAVYTDTTDTAVAIVAAVTNAFVGQSFELSIKNTVPFVATLAAASGVTLSGQTLIPGNSVLRALVTFTSLTAVSIRGIAVVPMTTPPLEAVTALTTVGAGTITGAGIAGGVTTRGGAQSATAFTDTTDSVANIVAALPNGNVGQSWEYTYHNNTDAVATLAGASSVTVSGNTVVPPCSFARFLCSYATLTTITMVGIGAGLNAPLPVTNFVTQSAGNQTAVAGELLAASHAVLNLSANNANAYTTKTGALMAADIPNIQIGQTWRQRIVASGNNTVTLTAGATGITITGTATAGTGTYRDYVVTYTAANTFVFQNIGGGTT